MTPERKNTSYFSCIKCNENNLKSNEILKCSKCKSTICLACGNVTEKRYNLMTREHKEKWQCTPCLTSKYKSPQNEANSNITMRNKNKKIAASPEKTHYIPSSNESCSSDDEASSLPDLSTYNRSDEIEGLHRELTELRNKLKSAENEIDRLVLQNTALNNATKDKENKIDMLKKICNEKSELSTGKKERKTSKKKRTRKRTKLNFTLNTEDKEIDGITANETDDKDSDVQTSMHESTTAIDINDTQTDIILEENKAKDKTQRIKRQKDNRKTILFFGSQQCKGLAKATSRNRENTPYEEHKVFSFIKPYAKSEDIVKTIKCEQLQDGDTVVLCLGENETNPIKLITELSHSLKLCEGYNIIILGIYKSTHLNEGTLNNTLKTICNNFENCTFIDTEPQHMRRKQYLEVTAQQINFKINCWEYERRFIKNIKSELQHRNTDTGYSNSNKQNQIPKTPVSIKNKFFRPRTV